MKWTTKYESIFLNKRDLSSVFILKLSRTLEFKNRIWIVLDFWAATKFTKAVPIDKGSGYCGKILSIKPILSGCDL